ncbi:hypothetical protein L9F63_015414, partial [Diploptera punctata]
NLFHNIILNVLTLYSCCFILNISTITFDVFVRYYHMQTQTVIFPHLKQKFNFLYQFPSNASTILFVVSASVLMRGLPGVDGCNATNCNKILNLLCETYNPHAFIY